MHIAYICHYFYPEPGAPSQRALDMGRRWIGAGHRVSVLTGFPNYPTGVVPEPYRGKRYMKETVEGMEVHRLVTYATPNEGFVKRTLGHLVFTLAAALQGMRRLERPDVVVTSSPTLFSGVAGWFLSRRFRVPFVFEVRDIWPAAMVALGVLRPGPVVSALERLEMFLYRRATRVVVVTSAFKADLVRRGVPADKIAIIPNGVDPQRFSEAMGDGVRRELGLEGKFVVEYAGAHGLSQNLGFLIDVAARFSHEDPSYHFLFVGDGAQKAELVVMAADAGLSNVTFLPSQPSVRMPEIYAAADVCLIPLRKAALFQTVIPSKTFEILASGRPVVASLGGEAAQVLKESGAALIVPPEDGEALAAAIRKLRTDPALRAEMGERGRAYVLRRYHRDELAKRYLQLLKEVAREGSR